MSNTNTGGAAFPQCIYNMKGGYDITGGMTLRDYFAAKAMPQFIHEVFCENLADHGYDSVAGHAYRMADAMLKAREQ